MLSWMILLRARGKMEKRGEEKEKRQLIHIDHPHPFHTLHIVHTRAGYGYPGSSSHILPEHNICSPKFSVGFFLSRLFFYALRRCVRGSRVWERRRREKPLNGLVLGHKKSVLQIVFSSLKESVAKVLDVLFELTWKFGWE